MAKETKFVLPKEGLLIRFPKAPKTILPVTGATVPWIGPEGRFWRRRNMDGSIIVFEDAEAAKPKKAEPKAATVPSPIRYENKKTGGNK